MSHSKSTLKLMYIIHYVQHKVIVHYSFIVKHFVFHNVWLFAWPTSTMHLMNIDFNKLQCSQRLIVFFIIIKICLHLHQQLGTPLLNHSQNHKLTMHRKRKVGSTPLLNHSQNHKLTMHIKRKVGSTSLLLNHSQNRKLTTHRKREIKKSQAQIEIEETT